MKILTLLEIIKNWATNCNKCKTAYDPKNLEISNIMDNSVKIVCTCSSCGHIAELKAGINENKQMNDTKMKLLNALTVGIIKAMAGWELKEFKNEVDKPQDINTIAITEDSISKLENQMKETKNLSVSDLFKSKKAL